MIQDIQDIKQRKEKMRHLAAYLLLIAGGNTAPTAADVKDLLGKSNIAVDEERLNQMISELAGML